MITKTADIKAAVNALLENATNLKIYGNDVVQGYEYPCLFVDMHVKTITKSKNYNENTGIFIITYMQEQPDELDALRTYDVIKDAFGTKLQVGNRYIEIEDIEYSYVGRDENIMQIEIDFAYSDRLEKKEHKPVIESVKVNM